MSEVRHFVEAAALSQGSHRGRTSRDIHILISAAVRRRMMTDGLNWVQVAQAIGLNDGSNLRKTMTRASRRPSWGNALKLVRWLEPGEYVAPPEPQMPNHSAVLEAENLLPLDFFRD